MADSSMLSEQPDNSISFASKSHAESDSESAAEVEGLPSLKPVVVKNKFIHGSDQASSTRFIDAAYPERNFNDIKAPPELVGLITDLLPILPRRPDPIGDGVDYAERILSRTRRIKALRKDSDDFTKIALQFWTDIKNDRRTSKHIAVPGTEVHIYLQEVLEHVRQFRRYIYSLVTMSLVKRSKKQIEIRPQLGKAVQCLRKLTRDARQRLGLAHKVLTIGSGPTPPARQPIMSFLYLAELVKSTMLSAHRRFRQDADSLYTDFPDLFTLQPFFLFFRNISLQPHSVKQVPKVRALDDPNGEEEKDPDSEAAQINTLINKIRIECRADRIKFSNVTKLNAWKNTAGNRICRWARYAFNNKNLFREGKPILTFEQMLITFCCAGYWTEAADVAELLVVAHRDFYKNEPKTTTNLLNFCNAVGLHALCLLQCERPQEAVLAIEDAMSVLRPLHKVGSNRTTRTMALLHIAHSRALLDLSKKSANDAIRLYLIRKSHDASCWVVPNLRKLSESPAGSQLDFRSETAYALRARTEVSKALREIAADLQQQHGKAKFCVTAAGGKPACCASFTVDESHYIHKVAPGLLASGSSPSAAVSVDGFRTLAKEQPELYEPILADALVWKARHFTDSDVQALANLREAETIYKRLTETFHNHFTKQLVQTYTLIASRCISTNRITEANVALGEGVRNQALLIHKPNAVLWRGYDVAASLAAAHAGVLSQLGHHKEALEEATKAERAIRALHHSVNAYGQYLAEPMLVKGISQLMLFEPSKALVQLTAVIQLLKVASNRSRTPCEKESIYILAIAWRAATKKALGEVESGLKEVEQALKLLQALRDAREGEARTSDQHVDEVEVMHPFLLTILSVFLLDTDPRQAIVKTHEALALVRTVNGRVVDPQTRKTALEVQALALNALERPLEASQVALEAELLPQAGFLDKLQCESPFDRELTARVEMSAETYLAKGPPPSEE